jgi:hypothetical protein
LRRERGAGGGGHVFVAVVTVTVAVDVVGVWSFGDGVGRAEDAGCGGVRGSGVNELERAASWW